MGNLAPSILLASVAACAAVIAALVLLGVILGARGRAGGQQPRPMRVIVGLIAVSLALGVIGLSWLAPLAAGGVHLAVPVLAAIAAFMVVPRVWTGTLLALIVLIPAGLAAVLLGERAARANLSSI